MCFDEVGVIISPYSDIWVSCTGYAYHGYPTRYADWLINYIHITNKLTNYFLILIKTFQIFFIQCRKFAGING